jgi:CRISPR-associated protein Csc1
MNSESVMIEQTFKATLYAPLFYSSSEGRAIQTQPTLSATALMHALGYRYFGLEKRYAEHGTEATTPNYSHLVDAPLFVTDMQPIAVETNERTFRSTDYRSERHFTTNDTDLARQVEGTKAVPAILERSGAAYQTIRNYIGITPGSTFEFTLWSEQSLPATPFFRMGIKQTGEFRAEPRDHTTLVLNKFLLAEVYDLSESTLTDLMTHSSSFRRGNDPRLQHFVDVDPAFVRDQVLPEVLS